jgi:tripartite-type tricarboxylate transporter receptor subunit TctC
LIWHGLYAPKGTPTAVLKTLEAALQKAVADPKLKAKFADLGALPATPAQARPEALRATLKAEIEKWGSIIREAGAHAD